MFAKSHNGLTPVDRVENKNMATVDRACPSAAVDFPPQHGEPMISRGLNPFRHLIPQNR
jgi:hypothetical protein